MEKIEILMQSTKIILMVLFCYFGWGYTNKVKSHLSSIDNSLEELKNG